MSLDYSHLSSFAPLSIVARRSHQSTNPRMNFKGGVNGTRACRLYKQTNNCIDLEHIFVQGSKQEAQSMCVPQHPGNFCNSSCNVFRLSGKRLAAVVSGDCEF